MLQSWLRVSSSRCAACGALLLTACASMGGRESLISDRPDFTESTATIAPRHVQIETGATVSREGPTSSRAIGELLVRSGLSSRLELRLAGNSWVREKTGGAVNTGREDAAIGVKLKLADGPDAPSWSPELSVIAHTTVPSGSQPFRAARMQPELKFLSAWTITSRLGFAANLNVGRSYNGARHFTEYAGSGSFGFSASERIGVYAEAFAFAPQDGSTVILKFVNSGITYLFGPDVQFDVRAGIGPSPRAGDYFVGAGLVVRR